MKLLTRLTSTSVCLLFFSLFFFNQISAQISGQIFKDINANGQKDTNEPLVSGVVINAYTADGTLCGSTTSVEFSDPNYSLSGCGTNAVRLEFIRPNGGCKVDGALDFSSQGAALYGSSIQFVSGNSTNVNYALVGSDEFNLNPANTQVFIPCYVNGDPLAGGSASTTDWFVGFPHGNTGSTAPVQKIDGAVIGSVWGVAYSKQAQKVFTSAFIKRHSGLGVLGSGGIYLLEPTASSFTATQFYDLDANGVRTRAATTAPAYGDNSSFQLSSNTITYLGATDPVSGEPEGLGVVGVNGSGGRNLPANSGTGNADPAAFDQVGKVGLGDLEISEDGRYLFVVNLYAKSVVRMELNDPYNPTSVVAVESFPLSDMTSLPNCTNGILRPFGLKYYRNKVYVGAVCTNEGRATSIPNNTDLSAHVFELNEPKGSSPNYTSGAIFSQTLDYAKGRSRGSQVDAFQNNIWNVWTNDWTSAFGKYPVSNVYPTPMLSGIEFSDQGNMILTFADRGGHQWGNANNDLNGNQTQSYQLGGHMLFVEKIASSCAFELENNGSTTNYAGNLGGIGNGEGPGGGEFFAGAFFTSGNNNPTPPNPFSGNHPSVAMGSAYILPGTNEIYITAMDPLTTFSGGTMQLDVSDGSKIVGSGYQLYSGGSSFGKAAGLGDIEISGMEAPVEIGNRVWNDTNSNGVQDADELGISNVTIALYDVTNSAVVATATTDANGNYIFSTHIGANTSAFQYGLNLTNGDSYELRIVNAEGSGQQTALSGLEVTIPNDDATSNGDERDSDGSQGMTSTIAFTLGAAGENNHSYDFGFRMPITTLPADCAVNLSRPQQVNCTQNSDGTFAATYQTTLSWTDAASEVFMVNLDGAFLESVTTSSADGSQIINFSVPADGTGVHILEVVGTSDASCATQVRMRAPVSCPPDLGRNPGECPGNTGIIAGSIWEDTDCNGIMNESPLTGVQGVQIILTDESGTEVGITYSDINGNYEFSGLGSQSYRVEIRLPETIDAWANPTHSGTNNLSNVSFAMAGDCVNLGVSAPLDFCQENPLVTATCYAIGEATNADNAIVGFEYDAQGQTSSTNNQYINSAYPTVGTVWGSAYSPSRQVLFTSAFMKRHSAFGTGGTGAIYLSTNVNNPTSSASALWLDLNGMSINTGTINTGNDPHDTADYDTDAINGANNPFGAVGKMSLGDLDISLDDRFLFTVNLQTKELYQIEIDADQNPATSPVAADISGFLIPDPGCNNGTYRPFGLGIDPLTGNVMVGVVCDGSNGGDISDLMAHVFVFDIATGVFNTSPFFSFSLDYERGGLNGTCETVEDWFVWNDDPSPTDMGSCGCLVLPQPVLADIAFDDADGSLILSFMDRFGHQHLPNAERYADGTAMGNCARIGGDLLRICNEGTVTNPTYSLENGGLCGTNGCGNTGNNGGETIEEYYCGDFYSPFHWETSLGGISVLPGKGEVITGVLDPFTTFSNGVFWMDNMTGQTTRGYEVLPQYSVFQKSAGLGDIDVLCEAAPLEIGNYVWCDSIENGLQDASERGVDGLIVQLYDDQGALVGLTTTNNGGQYYFNQNNVDVNGVSPTGTANSGSFTGLDYNTEYFIVFGDGQFNAGEFDLAGDNYGISSMHDVNANANDNIDSDVNANNLTTGSLGARPNGLPFIQLRTDQTGCGDHRYDFGLSCDPLFSIGNQVFYDDDNSGDRNGTEAGVDGITLQLLNANGTIYDSDPNTNGIQGLTVTTANGGYYRFDELPAGDYIVEIVAAAFAPSGTLETYISSTGAAQENSPNSNGDDNDNGLDVLVGGAVRSGIISLGNTEPLNEVEPTLYGAGSTTGTAAADEFSNLTVDFGFYRQRDRPDCCDPNRPPCTIEPCHYLSNQIYLGMGVTGDIDSNTNGTADADTDDGLLIGDNLNFVPGNSLNLPVQIYNNTGNNAYLRVWIDWNADGDFDDVGEQIADNAYAGSGSFTVSLSTAVPNDAAQDSDISIRLRLSTDDVNSSDPCGNGDCADDGEIEDYILRFSCPDKVCTPVQTTLIRS